MALPTHSLVPGFIMVSGGNAITPIVSDFGDAAKTKPLVNKM
jgi:hypothetical protein